MEAGSRSLKLFGPEPKYTRLLLHGIPNLKDSNFIWNIVLSSQDREHDRKMTFSLASTFYRKYIYVLCTSMAVHHPSMFAFTSLELLQNTLTSPKKDVFTSSHTIAYGAPLHCTIGSGSLEGALSELWTVPLFLSASKYNSALRMLP